MLVTVSAKWRYFFDGDEGEWDSLKGDESSTPS
jgi:hypothetical protein